MLAFVFDKNQLRTTMRLVERDALIATHDVDVIAVCRSSGQPCMDLSSFATDQDLRECRAIAIQLCDKLGAALSKCLGGHYSRLTRHIAHDLLYPFAYAIQIDRMARNALNSLRPPSVVCFEEDTRVFLWDPPRRFPDLANRVVRRLVNDAGINCQLLSADPQESSANEAADQQHIWNKSFADPLEPSRLITIAQGLSWDEQAVLIGRQVLSGLPVKPVSTAWMNYLIERPVLSDEELSSAICSARAIVCESSAMSLRWMDGPVFDPLWAALSGVIKTCHQYYRYGQMVCSALCPQIVITGYDVRGPNRCFNEGCISVCVETISILHGGINSMQCEGIRHNRAVGHLAVWSAKDVETVSPYRSSLYEIEPIGSLRVDIAEALERRTRNHRAIPTYIARRPCVVFLTCNLTGLLWFVASFDRHVESWDEIRALFLRRQDFEVLIKNHPRYDHADLYCGAGHLPGNMRITNDELSVVYDRADVVVMVNLETTAVLEAISRGIPVIHVNTASRGDPDPWVRDSGVVRVRSIPELEAQLDRLLKYPDYAARVAHVARSRLDSFIVATGDAALQRLADWVEKILRRSETNKCKSANSDALALLNFARWVDRQYLDPLSTEQAPDLSAIDPHRNDFVDCNRMPVHVLHRVTWYPWPETKHSRAASVWRIYRAFPRSWRPSLRVAKRYVTEGFRQDSRNRLRSCPARLGAALMLMALSAGQWFFRRAKCA